MFRITSRIDGDEIVREIADAAEGGRRI